MSYLIKIDRDTPSCCKDCILCKGSYIKVEVPGAPNITTADPSYGYQYVFRYYCIALNNEIIKNALKKHEKCPIMKGELNNE